MSMHKDLRFFKVKIKSIENVLKEIYQNYRSQLGKAREHSPKALQLTKTLIKSFKRFINYKFVQNTY